MKYYKTLNNEIRAIGEKGDIDGDQSKLVQKDWIEISYDEMMAIANHPKTEEQLLAEWKASRAEEVQNIKVTVDAMVFDGDEVSQTRMSRAIVAMSDNDTTMWVLANDVPTAVTKAQLVEALRLSCEAQTALWVKP